jgi:hypothetical protein
VGWLGAAYLAFAGIFLLLTRREGTAWLPGLVARPRVRLGKEADREECRDR